MNPLLALPLFPLVSLFQKPSEPEERLGTAAISDTPTAPNRIRCPLCKWQPNAYSLWCCGNAGYPENFFAGCGTTWNTFETGGRCPGCEHQWRWTACLACFEWSRHEDWYTAEPD